MAEILKITTPLVNKNQVQTNKPITDPTVPFNLQETEKIIQTTPQSDLLKQNNGMINKDEAPSILMNLLKDPSVTVHTLKNIFLLQEIIKLLPINNQAMTQEIEQLFNALLVKPDQIAGEMQRQADTSTSFKGEVFDFLRQLVVKNPTPEIRSGVATLLKAVNSMLGKEEVMGAVGNSLDYLSEALSASKGLSAKLDDLAWQFHQEDSPERFNELKFQVFDVFKEVENSILLSPKMTKVMSMTIYNLSRFNDNPDFFQEAVSNLLTLMDGKAQKAEFVAKMRAFLDNYTNTGNAENKEQSSKVMDVLAKIIGKQANDETITLMNPEKVEKIIHSLLSSPCNFTPLLHFVVPVEFMDLKSFAEFWVDPNEPDQTSAANGEKKNNIHMLITFDIEGIGQFEAEIFVSGEDIDLSLMCPAAYADRFANSVGNFEKCVTGYDYKFHSINIGKLERPRSLMEVFKSLPYKRTGVDVKI